MTSLLNRFTNFLLLNNSFQNQVGLLSGKSAAVIFFSDFNDNREAAISFLDEIQSQINRNTPLEFGHGVAGYGCLLEYLLTSGKIDDDTSQLMEEMEEYILARIHGESDWEPSLSTGVSGLGLFLLARIDSKTPLGNFQLLRLKEGVIACVNQLRRAWDNALQKDKTVIGLSLWGGWPGVLLFLKEVRQKGLHEPETSGLESEIINYLLKAVHKGIDNQCRDYIDCWFAVFQCYANRDTKLNPKVIKDFKKQIQQLFPRVKDTSFVNRMWHALMLHVIAMQFDLQEAAKLAKKIKATVVEELEIHSLPQFFPANENNVVNTGMVDGLCAVALPLQSMETNNFKWLSILGIHINHDNAA